MNLKKYSPWLLLVLGVGLGIAVMTIAPKLDTLNLTTFSLFSSGKAVPIDEVEPEIIEEYRWNMRVDTFKILEDSIAKNQFVSEILAKYKVDNQIAHQLSVNSQEVFDFRKFRAGKKYNVITEQLDNDTVAKFLVYEKDPITYIVYNLQDPTDIQQHERPTEKVERTISGAIQGSLWNTLIDGNADPELAVKLAKVYQWTIDFTRIQAGDEFKAVYDEIYVDGEYYRTDSIKASFFQHNGKEYYAFYYDQGEGKQAGFYDEAGESLKRAFLRAPVNYSRISSRYSGRRFHPVQKRYKAHLGTDYAAAHGTPIVATANGKVIASSYTRGNGKYVKIRHNDTYTTQYLHMSRRAVSNGEFVQQGEVIGYVGSTGLATGPHVCYRFWKHGKQVDHLRLDLPAGDPIDEKFLPQFDSIKSVYLNQLNESPKIIFPTDETEDNVLQSSFTP